MMGRPTAADLRELAARTRRLAKQVERLADDVEERVTRMQAWEAEKTARVAAAREAATSAGSVP